MKIVLKMNQNQPKGKSYNVTHFSLNNNNSSLVKNEKDDEDDDMNANQSLSLPSKGKTNAQPQMKSVIERGASWSNNETTILLSLWGQDMVQRQLTNSKRTRHVWEKIASKIKEFGFNRTPGMFRYLNNNT